MSELPSRRPRRTAARRETEQVTPLELFFDLIFVLAVTQCTAMMATTPTWIGLARALLVLAMLWWAWVGYSWLTSVVDPEEGGVRFAIFAAMAALLVVTLCIPQAFDDLAVAFAIAYGCVRVGQIVLFVFGSRDDPMLRRSVIGLAVSTAVAVALLAAAAGLDGSAQLLVWALAVLLDVSGPYVFGAEGWKLVPGHFAERHGLIVLIALGESIVAIGLGAGDHIDGGIVVAVVVAVAAIAAMWWSYFDLSAILAAERLERAAIGREQNELARDAYSYAHFLMVAGIVLFALGLKKTVGHIGDPLGTVPAFALAGGASLYYLGHVVFRWRITHSLNTPRAVAVVVLAALVPVAVTLDALVSLMLITAVLWTMVTFETIRNRSLREATRHRHRSDGPIAE